MPKRKEDEVKNATKVKWFKKMVRPNSTGRK